MLNYFNNFRDRDALFWTVFGAVVTTIIMALVWFVFLANPKIAEAQVPQVAICHATNSDNNPYNQQTVDWHSVIQGFGHNRIGHQGGEDIIPPGFWDPDGRNWNAEGRAIYRNGCEVPPVDLCENLDGLQEELPPNYQSEQGNCSCQEGYHTEEYGNGHEYEVPVCVPDEVEEYCEDENALNYKEEGECEYPDPTPTPTPGTPPTFAGSSTDTPVCTDGNTTQLPANFHVVRNGTSATVNFFITEGDSANLYWKVNDSASWQYAVSDLHGNSENFVSYTVNDLDANLGYTFGAQQVKGCGSGELVTAVVIDPPANGKTFRFSFWIW